MDKITLCGSTSMTCSDSLVVHDVFHPWGIMKSFFPRAVFPQTVIFLVMDDIYWFVVSSTFSEEKIALSFNSLLKCYCNVSHYVKLFFAKKKIWVFSDIGVISKLSYLIFFVSDRYLWKHFSLCSWLQVSDFSWNFGKVSQQIHLICQRRK